MSTYGRKQLGATGRPIMVAAGETRDVDWKTGGITLAWSLIVAVLTDTTLPDDTLVRIGKKFLRYGQIVCRVLKSEVQTITLANATGGTYTAAGSDPIAFDAAAAAVQAALEEVFGTGLVQVTGNAGGPYTVVFDNSLGNVAAMTIVDSTTGSGHSVTVATTNQGSGSQGKWGPYDPAATDGRQLLTPGDCYILNETVLEEGVVSELGGGVTDHPAVLDGGRVWKDRILMTEGTHSLAAGPTVAEVNAAFPRLNYVQS
jgi:hypothetical protein